jgi:hypothetical protein
MNEREKSTGASAKWTATYPASVTRFFENDFIPVNPFTKELSTPPFHAQKRNQ